jgi:CRISPR/Cas system CSM-associated protein Csm3 (group 7 of RAMP superfamily)
MAVFVNPYTFVPHVETPERRKPAGHAAMGEKRFSGILEVTVTAKTPLLIGGYTATRATDGVEVGVLPKRQSPKDKVMIPGSGLMGAVRSLHEALTGSCLRIVDTDWVPVHRHPVNIEEAKGLELAVVDEVDSKGRATHVRLCDDRVKIPNDLLVNVQPHGNALPQTGDQLRFEPGPHAKGEGLCVRPEGIAAQASTGMTSADIARIRPMAKVTEDCWVLLMTDTNARSPRRKNGGLVPANFAAGRVGPDSRRYVIPEDTAWKNYQQTVEGADDLRTALLPKGTEPQWGTAPPEYVDVYWPPRQGRQATRQATRQGGQPNDVIGRRLRARTYLHVGQPVWVRIKDNQVSEIRLSQYWRYRGDKSVGERIGEAKPCTDPKNLCWSCRMFGSANTEAREDNDTVRQQSYRGHVRIEDLIAIGPPVQPITWKLAPLASPKPSAGQFYLDNSAVPGNARLAEQNTKPAATWGSIADRQRTRLIRGRKFYWRTDSKADPNDETPVRSRRRPHQTDAMTLDTVELIPAGTVFTGRITFDNLDAAEYGSLLAALRPRMLKQAGEVGWDKAVTSVGGGKPFGFGSVLIDVKPLQVQTAAERYLGESELVQQPPTVSEALTTFRAAVPPNVSKTWTALQHALEFKFIDDAKVWYPPGTGRPGDESYDRSYEFFSHTTGLELSDKIRKLTNLPDAAGPAAGQELNSADGEERLPPDQQPRNARNERNGQHGQRRQAPRREERRGR